MSFVGNGPLFQLGEFRLSGDRHFSYRPRLNCAQLRVQASWVEALAAWNPPPHMPHYTVEILPEPGGLHLSPVWLEIPAKQTLISARVTGQQFGQANIWHQAGSRAGREMIVCSQPGERVALWLVKVKNSKISSSCLVTFIRQDNPHIVPDSTPERERAKSSELLQHVLQRAYVEAASNSVTAPPLSEGQDQ